MATEKLVQLKVLVTAELHRALKVYAAQSGEPIGALVSKAVTALGKQKRESADSEKRSRAVNLLKQRLEAVSAGQYVPDASKVTMADLFTMLAKDATAKGNRSRPKLGHVCKAFDVTVTKADDDTIT